MNTLRIAVLGSTRGSGLKPFVSGLREKQLPAEVVLVLSNKEQAGILQQARELALPQQCVQPAEDRQTHEALLCDVLHAHAVDVIVLMGYMRILSPYFIQQWPDKILNIHPSLLPDFSGLMDLAVHQAVLDAGKKETGCTVHLVNEVVDGGRIVMQKTCAVLENDSAESLKSRVQALEILALLDALKIEFCVEDKVFVQDNFLN